MRVKISITVELTGEQVTALAREYGHAPTAEATREFVQSYVRGYADVDGSPGADFWTLVR